MILTNLGKVDSTSGHGNRMVLWQTAGHGLLGVYTYTILIFSQRPFTFNVNCRASKEYNSCKRHKIIPNGYNIGRDWLVKRAVEGSRWKGMRWKAEVEWRTDLIESGEKGQLIFSISSIPTSQSDKTHISRSQPWHPPRRAYCDSHCLAAMMVLPFVFFRFPVSLLGWYALETHLKLYLFFDTAILFPIWILTIYDYVRPPMTYM
jgi:hypothetical protein